MGEESNQNYHESIISILSALPAETFSKFFQVPRREGQIDWDFAALLLGEAEFPGEGLALGLGAAVVLELHVEVEGDVGAVVLVAVGEGALVGFLDHVGSAPHFLLGLLCPDLRPLLLRGLQFLHFGRDGAVGHRVLLDLRDHDFVDQVHLPELLVVAHLAIVLRVD